MENLTTYYKVKEVTVFNSIGTGRYTKSSSTTYKNIYCTIKGSTIDLWVGGRFWGSKKTSSKFFKIDAKEIKESSFKKAVHKLKKNSDLLRAKKHTKNIVKSLVSKFQFNQTVIAHKEEIYSVIESKRETLLPLLNDLKNSIDKGVWHAKANQIVGTIGYDYVNTIGFTQVLNMAKTL